MNTAQQRNNTLGTATRASEATQTIFHVNIDYNLHDPEVLEARRAMKKKIDNSQSLITVRANQQVKRMIAAGELDQNDLDAVGNYRSSVMATFLRDKASWLNSVVHFTTTDELTVKSSEFHSDILRLALQGFVSEEAVQATERCLQSIANSISDSKSSSHTKGVKYIVLTTYYPWDEVTKTVVPKIRIIEFQTNQKTYEVVSGKRKKVEYKESKIKMTFSMTEADFNESLFDRIWTRVEPEFEAEVINSILDPIFDVSIPIPK